MQSQCGREINESLLLTPFNFMNNNDDHRKDNYVKEALFEFLPGANRWIWLAIYTQKLSYFLLFHHQCWLLLLIYSSLHLCWFNQLGTRLELQNHRRSTTTTASLVLSHVYVVVRSGELNLQDWQMTDEVAGVENDGLPIDGRDRRSV